VPLGIPQYLIHGLADSVVPASFSAAYTERARASGDDVSYLPLPGIGHMEMIDPSGAAFAALLACLDEVAEH
jgi:pimeloyl-ACP methyl ester carboxylesterase